MTTDGLNNPRRFAGKLSLSEDSIPILFRAYTNKAGVVVLSLDEIPFTDASAFILHAWHSSDDRVINFYLDGVSDDGVKFETCRLYFESIGPHSDMKRGAYYVFASRTSEAVFRREVVTSQAKPSLILGIHGFKSLPELRATCELGDLIMTGDIRQEGSGEISGNLAIQAKDIPPDVDHWRSKAEAILEHIRQVMSFAAGMNISDPICEFRVGQVIEVRTRAAGAQRQPNSPTFHPLDRQGIFDAAIRSFYTPQYKAENLWMALEWFAMGATYNEVRLVNAMTALENLVNSNTRDFARLLNNRAFDKLSAALATTVRQFIEEQGLHGDHPDLLEELTEKLAELKRRAFKRKLERLVERWSVPMEGISPEVVAAAISARNAIVHEGRYYVPGKALPDLWEHVCVIREIVTRMIFRVLGYEGRYISRLGGYHGDAIFPPGRKRK